MSHAFHSMCGCAQCCRTERAAERDDEMRDMYRDDLIACPDFIAELALKNEEAERAAAAVKDADMAELGRIVTTALYRAADELIATRADESGITPGEAAQRMYEVYRPDTMTNGGRPRCEEGGMSGVDVLAVMDSEYWTVYGQLHSLCKAANHDKRHGQVSTKHVLACLDGTGAAIDAAVEARSAVAELIEAAGAVVEAHTNPSARNRLRAALARCRGGAA